MPIVCSRHSDRGLASIERPEARLQVIRFMPFARPKVLATAAIQKVAQA
jgi:hypothetical protein